MTDDRYHLLALSGDCSIKAAETVAAQLRAIAEQHHRPVRDITTAVDAAVGDLATATYR